MSGFHHAVRIAAESLSAYRMRTFLTALGIAVGVSTVISIEGIIQGLNAAFRDQIAVLGTGTLYVSQKPWVIVSDWWKYWGRPPITRDDAEYLETRVPSAKAIVPFVYHRAPILIGTTAIEGARIIGTTERWTEMSGIEPLRGRFFARGEVDTAQPVVAVGADLADILRKEGVEIGDEIRVGKRRVRVIGEMPSRGSTFGISQDDFVAIPLSLFDVVFGSERSLTIGVVVSPDEVDRGTDEIVGALRARRHIPPEEPEESFSINSQGLLLELYATLTRSLFATAVGLAFITLVVGGVGIMNIMLVAVAERTREIGIRKALGARPAAILSQFVIEASLVSGLGGLCGTVGGMLVARVIANFTPLPATVPAAAAAFGVSFGVFVGLVFGFLPAYRAARLAPVDALRAE